MVLDDLPHFPIRPKRSVLGRFMRRRWGEPLAFSFIFLAGLLIFLIQFWTWAIPQLTLLQEFVPAKGVVVETRLVERTVDSTVRYRPEVLLDYHVDEKNYSIWTYDFQTLNTKEGFLADIEAARKALAPFEDGLEVECWYRLGNPEQVIVAWNVSVWGWFFLLLSFSLIVLGLIGFCQSFRFAAVSQERKVVLSTQPVPAPLQSLVGAAQSTTWPTVPDIRIINESPGTHLAYRLPLGNQPIFPLAGITIFTFAWNAVAWAILLHSMFNPARSWSDQLIGNAILFLLCGVGAVLLVWVFHQFVLAFSLGPTLLEISDHPVYPGRRYRMLLQQSGVLRFHELTVDIVCEEVARFRQGTDTTTSRKDVFRQNLFSRSDFETMPDDPLKSEFFVQLPHDAMHSFRQENNEVVWKIEIFAKIAGWPDIRRECPIIVRPIVLNDLALEGGGL